MDGRRTDAPSFVLDAMLGRLAHWLRAMGYDSLYLGAADDARLLDVARAEGRVLLTRDVRLARAAGERGCLVRAEDVDGQLTEAVTALGLDPPEDGWLSRCLECNTPLEARAKETVREAVPAHVFAARAQFWGCPGCGKTYWAGSHADQMLERLARVLRRTGSEGA